MEAYASASLKASCQAAGFKDKNVYLEPQGLLEREIRVKGISCPRVAFETHLYEGLSLSATSHEQRVPLRRVFK